MRLPLLALLIAFALTGTASAKTHTLTGSFTGDPGSKLTMKVTTTKKGVAKRVKSFKVSKAAYRCAGGPDQGKTGTISESFGGAELRESGKKFSFNVLETIEGTYWSSAPAIVLNRKGTRASGELSYAFSRNESRCGAVGKFALKTKPKPKKRRKK